MKKFLTIFILLISSRTFALSPITTTQLYGTGACIGATCTLSDSTTGGTWSSSNTAIASVSTSGVVTGVSAGSATITYTAGVAYVTTTFYVTATPASITGTGAICVDSTLALNDATVGGTWTSSSGVSVSLATGVVTGYDPGDYPVYYIMGAGCYAETTVTVNPLAFPIDSIILGLSEVCIGSGITLSNATPGGAWSSSNLAVGTVNAATGVVTGIAVGTTTISYTIATSSCGPASIMKTVTVANTTNAGTVSGTTAVNVGSPGTTLSDVSGDAGGTWSSSNTSVAIIGGSTGVISGISAGTATISYSVTGCSGLATATQIETVSNIDGISGYVLFSSTPPTSSLKVWLITYNPSTLMLEAIDSLYLTGSGTSYYYQFLSVPTDSFRVKAALPDSTGVTGFIPTYHDTSFYWNYASVIAHDSGTADINKNINMLVGTGTSGPGFIAGNVTTGANRGTSMGIPVVNLHIIAINTSSNTIAGVTSTGVSGNYSFNLPYGTYTIFPDSLNYATTPYANITLSSSTPTFGGASFIQDPANNTITPITTAVKNVLSSTSSVSAFPNPTSGKLNIQWTEKAAEKGTLSISDISGREVYRSTINMTQGQGMTAVDLSGLMNGVYMVNITSASLNYNDKIEVVH